MFFGGHEKRRMTEFKSIKTKCADDVGFRVEIIKTYKDISHPVNQDFGLLILVDKHFYQFFPSFLQDFLLRIPGLNRYYIRKNLIVLM